MFFTVKFFNIPFKDIKDLKCKGKNIVIFFNTKLEDSKKFIEIEMDSLIEARNKINEYHLNKNN